MDSAAKESSAEGKGSWERTEGRGRLRDGLQLRRKLTSIYTGHALCFRQELMTQVKSKLL